VSPPPPGPPAPASELAWRPLTSLPRKRELYSQDTFFREGWWAATAAWEADASTCLWRTALVLFKPEAVAGRRVGPATRLLETRGFAPVAAQRVDYDGNIYHALYRYQLRRATLDKLRLYTRWAAGHPALLAAFADLSPSPGLPASVRLKMMKGHALVHRRSGDDLRSFLKSPNSILNFLHSADEPADLVRELPILLPASRRGAFLQAVRTADVAAGRGALGRLIARLGRMVPRHDVNPREAGRRIRAIALGEANPATPGPAAKACVDMVDAVLRGEHTLDLTAFESALGDLVDRVAPLDVFTFGTEFIERDLHGAVGDLDDDCVPGWLSGA
jgi:hypothetical protein